MSINGDPYESGTPKYNSAQSIYDALQEMATGEEIGILSEMFTDISWEGQDYYYTDNAGKLVERWGNILGYGQEKMWLMDIAAWQIADEDANDWIYQILCNDELAKRIGFKNIFCDIVIGRMHSKYKEAIEAYDWELGELSRFGFYENSEALAKALKSIGYSIVYNPYSKLISAVYDKLKGLRIEKEKQLITESRAMLTAYDDFMYGLKMNQALYQEQEKMYRSKLAQLQAKYENAMQLMIDLAQKQGVTLRLPDAPLLISEKAETTDG